MCCTCISWLWHVRVLYKLNGSECMVNHLSSQWYKNSDSPTRPLLSSGPYNPIKPKSVIYHYFDPSFIFNGTIIINHSKTIFWFSKKKKNVKILTTISTCLFQSSSYLCVSGIFLPPKHSLIKFKPRTQFRDAIKPIIIVVKNESFTDLEP